MSPGRMRRSPLEVMEHVTGSVSEWVIRAFPPPAVIITVFGLVCS